MKQQTPILNVGDKIGFVFPARGIDDNDKTIFFPVVEITERGGERAYRYQFPDGSISSAAIRQSDLVGHPVQIEAQINPKMICLSERKGEFRKALERGKDSRLEVYADWERDSFVVVNEDNGSEYRVKLETRGRRLFGECDCKDFAYRKRVCKHLSEVLTFTLFTVRV